jgi:predicted PurR-regulated permease PerM
MPNNDSITVIRRRFYLTFTVIGIVVLLWGAAYVLGQIWTPISIVLFSAFLVFLLRVPVAWMERKGVPRVLGAAIMYVVTLAVIAVILLIFLPVIIEQIIGFASLVPGYVNDSGNFFNTIYHNYRDVIQDTNIQQVVTSLGEELTRWSVGLASESASFMFTAGSSIANAFLVAGVSLIVGFWILKDLPTIGKEIMVIVGPRRSEDVRFITRAFSRSLGGYLRGMVVSCVCTGTMAGIAYAIIGIPYPLVMAFFTGLMVFIPFIGPTIAWLLAGLIGLFVAPLVGILALALTIAAQMVNDNFIAPRVMSSNVELFPGLILVVIFVGAALGGIFGMLCAVPLTAAVKQIFVYYFEKRTGRHLVAEKGALFKGHSSKQLDAVHDAADDTAHDAADSAKNDAPTRKDVKPKQ